VSPNAPSLLAILLCAGVLAAPSLRAQTITGTVLESSSDTPVPGAVVRLLSADSEILATTLSDSTGTYSLSALDPGNFMLSAARLGFFEFVSPLLSASNPSGIYPVDLALVLDPVELEGITVRAEQQAGLAQGLRRSVGLDPRGLSHKPIGYDQLMAHVVQGHDLVDVVRRDSGPRILIRQDPDGPCFLYRNRSCLPVYLDGDRIPKNIVEVIPVDMLEYAVIVTPTESVQYAGGGVLLFTYRWLWWNR
jgi:hypothetical protein